MANPFYVAGNILWDILKNTADEFLRILPGLLAAIILLFFGWLIAKIVRRGTLWVLKKTNMDRWVKRHELSNALFGMEISVILTGILKWYIILIFAETAISLIQTKFTNLLSHYWYFVYFALILILGFILVSLLGEYIKQRINRSNTVMMKNFADIIKILIIYLGIIIMLQIAGYSLDILTRVFEIALMAFAIVVAIIIGIGFAISYSDETIDLINKFSKKKKKK